MTVMRKGSTGRKGAWAGFALALACLVFIFLPGSSQGRDIRLAWDGNAESDLAGYKIYYGWNSGQYGTVVDVGSRTSYAITGLDDTKDYYIATTAYNTTGTESVFSNEVASAATGVIIPPTSPSDTNPPATSPSTPADTPSPAPSSDSGGGGGGCFIATAAYGSYLAPEVMVLRHFRDHYLLTNGPGTLFVKCYYRYSPPFADFISRHEWLRTLTRWLLSPMVYGIKYSLSALMLLLGLAGSAYTFRVRRRAEAAACRIPMPEPCGRSAR